MSIFLKWMKQFLEIVMACTMTELMESPPLAQPLIIGYFPSNYLSSVSLVSISDFSCPLEGVTSGAATPNCTKLVKDPLPPR